MMGYDDFFHQLADAGINYVRIRVFNDPFFRHPDYHCTCPDPANPTNASRANCPADHSPVNRPPFLPASNTARGFSPFPGNAGFPALTAADEGMGYGGGNTDIHAAERMGVAATNAGLRVNIAFHYSDFWADPGARRIPKAWRGLTQAELYDAIFDFTYDSVKQLLEAGVDVGMIGIGNESNGGIAGQSHNAAGLQMYAHAMAAVDQLMWMYREGYYPSANLAVYLNDGDLDGFHIKKGIHRDQPQASWNRDIAGGLRTFNTNNPRGLFGTVPGTPLTGDERVCFEIVFKSWYSLWRGAAYWPNAAAMITDDNVAFRDGSRFWPKEVITVETSYPFTSASANGFETIFRGTASTTPQCQADDNWYAIYRTHNLPVAPANAIGVEPGTRMGTGVFYFGAAGLAFNTPEHPAVVGPPNGKGALTDANWNQDRNNANAPFTPTPVWESLYDIWNEYGIGWASRYSSYYVRTTTGANGTSNGNFDEGLHHGGAPKDNVAFHDFWGFPLPSMTVWRDVFDGAGPPVQSGSIYVLPGANAPETVNVDFNDGTSGTIAVTWNEGDVAEMKAGGSGTFRVRGDVVWNDNTYTVIFNITVAGVNLLLNPSFETTGNPAANWTVSGGSGQALTRATGANNARTGNAFLQLNGAGANRVLSQTIALVEPGYYTMGIHTQSGITNVTLAVSGETVNLESAATTVTELGTTAWGTYLEIRMDNILVEAAGEVTVSYTISSSAWGTVDDAFFMVMHPNDVTRLNAPPLAWTPETTIEFVDGMLVTDIIETAVSNAGASNIPVASGNITYSIVSGTSIIHSNALWLLDEIGTTTIRATKSSGNFFENNSYIDVTFDVVGSLAPSDLAVVQPVGPVVYGGSFQLTAELLGAPVDPQDVSFELLSGGAFATATDGGLVTVTGVGSFRVRAEHNNGDISNPITITSQPRPVTIAVGDIIVLDKLYNGSNTAIVEFNLSEASGFLVTDLGGRVTANLVGEPITVSDPVWTLPNLPDDTGRAARLTARAVATFATADVGNGITVNITDITLGGTERSNYVLTSTTATATGNILPNPVVTNNPLHIQRVDGLRQDFMMGIDISTEPALRAASLSPHTTDNIVWRDSDGVPADLYDIFASHGVNWVRARIWNDPYFRGESPVGGTLPPASQIVHSNYTMHGHGFGSGGYGAGNSDVDKAIEMGIRATDAGMRFLANFHFSDFWADPQRQRVPKDWVGTSVTERAELLYDFTFDSLERMVLAGVDVGMVQIGNETNPGMAGMSGANMHTLMRAGMRAIDDINEKYGLDILRAVHFTDPQNFEGTVNRAHALYNANVEYDVFMLSWYPYIHGTPQQLTDVMNYISQTFDVYVVCGEVSYAPVAGGYGAFTQVYPQTPQGQAHVIRDAIAAVAAVENNRGLGVFYWEPAWPTTTSAANRFYGTGWAARYAHHYDSSGTGDGNSTRNTSQMFIHNQPDNRRPLPSMDVWNLVFSGAEGTEPVAVYNVPPVLVPVVLGNPVVMPSTVYVVYTNNERANEPVVWNAEDIAAANAGASGDFTIRGTITLTNLADAERAVTATVQKRVANLVVDPSFEYHHAVTNPTWTVTGGTAGLNMGSIGSATEQAGNARTGTRALHFGNGGAGRTVSQEIYITTPGFYIFSAWIQGNISGTFIFNVTGDNVPGNRTWNGRGGGSWGTFVERGLWGVYVDAPGPVTISLTTAGTATQWGALDDVYFAMMDTPLALTLMEANAIFYEGQGDFTDATWTAFTTARNAAITVIQPTNGQAPQAGPSATAVTNLITAMNNLVALFEITVIDGTADFDEAEEGELITITADTPATGYRFVNWTSDDDVDFDDEDEAETTFEMPASDVTVTANFEQIPPTPFTVTVTGGTASPSSALQGATVTVTATVPSGYRFTGWTVLSGGVSLSNANNATTTFIMGTANVALNANFAPIDQPPVLPQEFTISFNANGGTGTMPAVRVTEGANAIIPANAFTRAGYEFAGWNTVANGSGTAFAAGATISNVRANITLYAQWNEIDEDDPPREWLPPQATNPFIDVPSHPHWQNNPVSWAVRNGITTGIANTNPPEFRPNDPLTREAFAIFLHRVAGTPDVRPMSFTDDALMSSRAEGAVRWGVEAGIILGFADNTFRPQAVITREQIATMLFRFAEHLEKDLEFGTAIFDAFPDSSRVNEWALEAMQWATYNGLITGIARPDGPRLEPQGNATRAQAVAIIYRFVMEFEVPPPESE